MIKILFDSFKEALANINRLKRSGVILPSRAIKKDLCRNKGHKSKVVKKRRRRNKLAKISRRINWRKAA